MDDVCYLGIINLTPDSFSDGDPSPNPKRALLQGKRLLAQGATVLDIGAESTRPGASPIDQAEEWGRLRPGLDMLRSECPDCMLSVDTRNAETAALALERGADIINDVTGFHSREMLDLAKKSDCGLIAVRSRFPEGDIRTPDYSDAAPKTARSALQELETVKNCLLDGGIEPDRMLLDPGFGFGTTFLEDSAIWGVLGEMPTFLDWPVERFCIGISRKRFVARRFGVAENNPLDGKTAELHKTAANMGYGVFRTHSITGGPIAKRQA